ncbi:cytochrome PufQ [Tateyamaria omphalii]|uniref:Protein pufQ n=1 Tax=Tateyamaria omphalii TaxID=299262 RepID=A0A1P8N1L3_9RHOB|nr:cytochrome PufQ [Tateyamaria omphalii]APX14196.1 protein pufQ [Tateyamaria omphalii]
MTDMTSNVVTETPRKRSGEKTEFMVYFAIIFVATLPLACLTWALAALKSRSFTDKGPMARAWTQARIITPMIFNA